MIREKLLINNVIQMAHDIRSPLLALQVVLESDGEFNDKKRGLLLRAALRLQEIADSIMEENKNSSETCLKTLIAEIVDEKKATHEKDIFEFKVESHNTYFKNVNSVEMKRVISNLINNSIEACEGKTAKVRVQLMQFGERVQIKIKDNGKGIPPMFSAKIFERGVTIGKEKGSGMGLSHARDYIESLGGFINISSDQMETTVSIYL